ncbi:MAG: murein L,D-transpeptidase [Gammaproteobacteria bacterium]|nr:murein L,D-transpeptidase [Gammaproteobacteria bacterium]
MTPFKFFTKHCFSLLLLILPVSCLLADELQLQQPGVSKEIFAVIAGKQHTYLQQSNFANRADDLDALYKRVNYQSLWLGNSNSAKQTADALDLMAAADTHGLIKGNYDVDTLRQKYHAALDLSPSDYRELALYDTAVSIALLRYLHDMHYGRINPQGINYNLQLREKKVIDLPALIKDSVALNTVSQLPILVEPKLHQYQKLKTALANYKLLAGKSPSFQFNLKGKLRPGEKHPQIAELRQFLTALGDITATPSTEIHNPETALIKSPKTVHTAKSGAVGNSSTYSPDVVEGIQKYQLRHGLGADGAIGPTTVAAINEPLTKRINQIEMAMERLRWLPEINVNRSIIVNIPAFQLWAIDEFNDKAANITNMRVVVGKALKNQTPVLMGNMSYIEFMPYWNVPKNILKDEVIPKLSRNPAFLSRQNMEVVSNHGKPVPLSATAIENLRKGAYRVRQRPGVRNSLGKVKFIFPNKDDVYLHDTPSNSLFNRSRRDFSHGCVRVENPLRLAEFALKNQDNWTTDAIKKAMNSASTRHVQLQQPIPVLFFYTTAFVDQNNNLAFYPDIYGHDTVLMQALQKTGDLPDQAIFVSTSAETPSSTETTLPINSPVTPNTVNNSQN